jgi:Fe-S-cluster-containing dehydrogenase component
MQKSLHIDPGTCTNCLQCELACSYDNEGVFNPAKSRIKVFTFHDEGRFVLHPVRRGVVHAGVSGGRDRS